MKFFLALLLLGAAAFGAACSSNSDSTAESATPGAETPSETPVPGTETPLPVPGLTFGSSLGPGGRLTEGTHCWAGRCVDMAGPITSTEPVVIPAGMELQLVVEGVQPSELLHMWVAVPANPERQLSNGQFVWLNVGSAEHPTDDPVTTPSDRGEYILLVFTRWDGGGDYSFAGYFDVR